MVDVHVNANRAFAKIKNNISRRPANCDHDTPTGAIVFEIASQSRFRHRVRAMMTDPDLGHPRGVVTADRHDVDGLGRQTYHGGRKTPRTTIRGRKRANRDHARADPDRHGTQRPDLRDRASPQIRQPGSGLWCGGDWTETLN